MASPHPSTNPETPAAQADEGTGSANQMWGGHYAVGPSEVMTAINASIDVDKRLYAQDIAGSVAHATMLAAQGILAHDEVALIVKGLRQIEQEIAAGHMVFTPALEDIHMHVESRLAELIGPVAGKLHTARSRNDQVVTDFRLWVRGAVEAVEVKLQGLLEALLAQAQTHAALLMPGFTHWQPAQPVTFGHHLMAYVEMFGRDKGRFEDARRRMNECPLGAAALAGTSFPIDRHATAKALGFAGPMRNSLDAVSDRDFALETLSAAAICAVHLSRLGEELVLWSSPLVGFIKLSEGFTTGSSIMPQKRNPDAAELIRGKAGPIFGRLQGLLATMKGLPLAYNKDTQEDKAPLFAAMDDLLLCLEAARGMVTDLTPQAERMGQAAEAGYSTATDLADWLVRSLGMPFRQAHHVTGRIVRLAEERGIMLAEVPLADMQAVEPGITADVFSVLSAERSAASRMSFGGTAPQRVKEAVRDAQKRFGVV